MKKTALIILLMVTAYIFAGELVKYGEEITLTKKTAVSAILEDPASFDGQKVLIEGTVIGVCEKRGCWIDISSDKDGEKIRVKVEDGVITFSMEAKGEKALVEGTVYSIEAEKTCAEGEAGCGADTKKEEAGCCSKAKVTKVFQIKGSGAVIG